MPNTNCLLLDEIYYGQNKSKIIDKELLEKFHLISYIPKFDELLDPDFIWTSILSILKNFENQSYDEEFDSTDKIMVSFEIVIRW